MNNSPRYHLNKEDLTTVSWTIFHVLLAALVTELVQLIGKFDFGTSTPLVMTILTLFSGVIKQYFSGPSCQTDLPPTPASPSVPADPSLAAMPVTS